MPTSIRRIIFTTQLRIDSSTSYCIAKTTSITRQGPALNSFDIVFKSFDRISESPSFFSLIPLLLTNVHLRPSSVIPPELLSNMPDYSGDRTHTPNDQIAGVPSTKRKQPSQQTRQLLSCTKCRERKVKVGSLFLFHFNSRQWSARSRDKRKADMCKVRPHQALLGMLCSRSAQGLPVHRRRRRLCTHPAVV